MPLSREALEEKFRVIYSREPQPVGGQILYLGEIERKCEFEGKSFPMIDKAGRIYPCPDDTGLAVSTNEGLVVISGCAHSGICNTVEYAKKLTGASRVRAVLGGFHLLQMDETAQKTIDYIRENAETVWLAHCTADEVCEAFEAQLPGRTHVLGAGLICEWR